METLISPIISGENKPDGMSKIAERYKWTNNCSGRGPRPLWLFFSQHKRKQFRSPSCTRWRRGSGRAGLQIGRSRFDYQDTLTLWWQGDKRRLWTSQRPCLGRLGKLKTPSCQWRRVPGSRSKFGYWTTVPSLYSWNIAECEVKTQPTNQQPSCQSVRQPWPCNTFCSQHYH